MKNIIVNMETIFKIYNRGIDYWQLSMEKEREQEEIFDWFQWVIVWKKYAMPSQVAERREIRSEKWMKAKSKSYNDFMEFLGSILSD